ncbi:hypothetical protein TRL7639_00136 [Falsiruegeria litorea R37]|uniref:DUF262 domain-containing protein n=1 Tax=Falsiruegeria litorea R37 TaxID=1200284 RepID=A0A1Y5RAW8_9RHOB|nr:DUF262 domain-containing protein [Falsiruegeria litorea]SLN12814.1 hypothetical protein TRL7639_00136 [Falsiruegeria litorea R37]
MKIESQDKRIDQLLKGSTFLIPRFQRAYSWEPDHVNEFWSDIIENLSEAYFIGSMVVYTVGRSSLAVVDGQQRLTTLTILLCAIREGFKSLDQIDLADGLQAFVEQKDRENQTVYVLQTETSFPYLQEEILKNGPAEAPYEIGREEEAIQKAFGIFNEKIGHAISEFLGNKEQTKDENVQDATDWLSRVRDTVFDLNVILVTLDNEDDAYLIFETLNTRGKDLALSDLLRNHFTKFVKPEAGVDQSKLKWGKVLDTISSAPMPLDPDTFIVHSWQSRYDFVTKAKTFQKFKEAVTKKNAKAHLNRLLSDSDLWRSIFDTDYGWDKPEKDVSRSLAAMRTFKVVQPTPGMLSLIRAYKDGVIKYKVLRNALANIEKFHFSFNAVTSSRSSGGISGMYSSFGRQVFAASDSNEVGKAIADLVGKLREREVPTSEFDAGFEQIIYTKSHSSQKALVQYVLKKVALFESQPYIGETDDLTIEHLLPQSSAKDGESDDLIGQLGNLMLVDSKTNEMLSTNKFKQKKEILKERGYKLPDILEEVDMLDSDVIRLNTMRLSELARTKIWKV